jgi:uncharacterized membrane protein YfcA
VSAGSGVGKSSAAASAPIAAAAKDAQIVMDVARKILALIARASLRTLLRPCLRTESPRDFFDSCDPVYVNGRNLNTVTGSGYFASTTGYIVFMNAAQLAFYVAIGLAGVAFIIGAVRAARRSTTVRWPTPIELVIGFVTDFFDTLGIGSFAPTTAIYKLRRIVPDELIPGTLNVGHTPSAIAEALIFVTAIVVDPLLLVTVVGSAAAGAWLGAGVVARLPRRAIQVTMGVALLIAGIVFTAINLGALPGGGTAMALGGWKFGFAVGINFILGALMSAGIGMYAPCMITLALLGMHPLAAFPIMMGACALLQPVASLRFFQTGQFAWGPLLGLAFGGVIGVLIAAYIVKTLPLFALRWLVIVVIAYAAFAMLRSAVRAES